MSQITHVVVGYECTHCKGSTSNRCQIWWGAKLLNKMITLQEFSQLFVVDEDFTFRPVREERKSSG